MGKGGGRRAEGRGRGRGRGRGLAVARAPSTLGTRGFCSAKRGARGSSCVRCSVGRAAAAPAFCAASSRSAVGGRRIQRWLRLLAVRVPSAGGAAAGAFVVWRPSTASPRWDHYQYSFLRLRRVDLSIRRCALSFHIMINDRVLGEDALLAYAAGAQLGCLTPRTRGRCG